MVFSHSYPAGTLSVTIFEAKDLKNQDFMGKNDPYVELWLDDDYKQRSSEVSNSNNPVWNETFTFNIAEGSSAHKLYLKVLDKDVVGSDKIGEAKIDFADVYQGNVFDDWVKLPAKLGLSSHGEVRVRVEFAPN